MKKACQGDRCRSSNSSPYTSALFMQVFKGHHNLKDNHSSTIKY